MEKRTFKTYVVSDHDLNRSYVRGRISGIAFVMSRGHRGDGAVHAWKRNKSGSWEFIMECTLEQYIDFHDVIEELYPGLCWFDTSEMAESVREEGL